MFTCLYVVMASKVKYGVASLWNHDQLKVKNKKAFNTTDTISNTRKTGFEQFNVQDSKKLIKWAALHHKYIPVKKC